MNATTRSTCDHCHTEWVIPLTDCELILLPATRVWLRWTCADGCPPTIVDLTATETNCMRATHQQLLDDGARFVNWTNIIDQPRTPCTPAMWAQMVVLGALRPSATVQTVMVAACEQILAAP